MGHPERDIITNRPPMQDVNVLGLTRLLPGPVCSRHLADMGTDVIKIEGTGAGSARRPRPGSRRRQHPGRPA
jgi:crotonobetainyl-CoA:carnitine CoA-transferase CaiB-like acyl-CoA transferase